MVEENARRLSAPAVIADPDARALAARMRRVGAEAALSAALGDGARNGDALRESARGRAVERDVEGEHSDSADQGEDGPNAESAALLEDISVALVVELGRVQVSAADVVQLRAGQVIELSRAPGEPVDLVVDGKRIGKGELVEIDGELGVRILSLAK